MNSAQRALISLIAILLAVPLAALAREHGSRAGGGAAVNRRGNGLVAAQPQHWGSHRAGHQLIGRTPHSYGDQRFGVRDTPSFYSPYYSQNFGWLTPYNSFWTNPYAPQDTYSQVFPYLYFYDLYAQEAERSRQAADEFEASLAREGKLTGPTEPGSSASDSRPLLPRDVALTLDDQPLAMSASGGPVVIGSGRHTLRIAARGAE